ncbi:MAG: hypothetical protein WA691_00355 [Thermoplasmata archaeon]
MAPIGIHDDDDLSAGRSDAGEHSRGETHLTGAGDEAEGGLLLQPSDLLGGSVGGAIVDDDALARHLPEERLQSWRETLDTFPLVVRGEDYAHERLSAPGGTILRRPEVCRYRV